MITNLKIKNFKSIKEVSFDCRRINIFIGPPGGGKSNILEALFLFSREAKDEEISKEILRIENIQNIFFMNDITKSVKISINNINLELFSKEESIYMRFDKKEKSFSFYNLEEISKKVEEKIGRIKMFRYVREKVLSLKYSNEICLKPPFGENLVQVLKSRNDILNVINRDVLVDFRIVKVLGQKEIFLMPKKFEELTLIPLKSISDGTLRYIFNLLAIETSKENEIILLEEPESNIFPYFVRDLAIRICNSKSQFFITTHNPYFVETFFEKARKDELAIHWVWYENGTKVKTFMDDDLEKFVEKALETDVFMAVENL